MDVEVSRYIFAPPDVVWAVLTDWERQADWMRDAREVAVLTDRREGEGVLLRCPTQVVGITVDDEMEVTAWEEGRRLAVRHLGPVIRGTGAFLLEPTPVGTRVVWREQIDPPLGAIGEVVGRTVARPYLRRLFARSLDGLKRASEREARRRRLTERR